MWIHELHWHCWNYISSSTGQRCYCIYCLLSVWWKKLEECEDKNGAQCPRVVVSGSLGDIDFTSSVWWHEDTNAFLLFEMLHKVLFLYSLLPFFFPLSLNLYEDQRGLFPKISLETVAMQQHNTVLIHTRNDCVNALFPEPAAWLLMQRSGFSSSASFPALTKCTFCYLFFNITW